MSELKAFNMPRYAGAFSMHEVYLKSEADKVISHHKYKRCLAMADMCECKRIDAANYRIPRKKWEFYDKWYRRWIELAKVFK